MDFKLTINMDNAAFEGGGAKELGRILAEVAQRVRRDEELDGKVRDINGNTVGKFEVVP